MHKIRLLPDKLSVLTPTGGEYGICWLDVYRVHTSRQDLITESSRVLYFDYDYGHYIEVNDGMDGFEEMVSRLGEYLTLPADYRQQIEATQCHAEPVRLYSRP
jgi:hypothetical protein